LQKVDLIYGIMNVFSPMNLIFCFIGAVLGTLVGVLPGLGPASALAILLPITQYLDPLRSIIMLAGLYYGAAYGGSTTSILVNIPGEVGAVPTCFDGFPMTKQGKGGQALWIAAVGSFIAGTLAIIVISFVGPGVARYALKFAPPEYFGLIFFSMTGIVSLSGSSITKGLAAGLLGMVLSCVGVDQLTGLRRFNFGSIGMMRGFDLVPVMVGIFGIGEILLNAEEGLSRLYEGKLGKMMPRGKELIKGLRASIHGSLLGIPLGVLPGVTPGVIGFLAYDLERKISKYPEKFGTGVIEGVASVEAANNATAQANFIPLMCFGIPTGASMAIILAALMMYGLQPGPMLFQLNKTFAWTVIGSMYIGNFMLLVLNLPLVGIWARISTIPYKYLGPTILAICIVGAYAPRNTMFDVWVAFAAGVVGYLMRKNHWPIAPPILGLILGPMMEQSLRQALSMGGGWTVFLHRPVAIGFFVLAAFVIVVSLKIMGRAPSEVFEEDIG
jgi:putative tricarboxylic transport membrane protein